MTDQTNTPELRFPEFKKEWQCNTLDNCCYKISDGIHSTPIYSKSGDFSFINGNNLINGKIHFENAKLVDSKEALKHKRNLTYNETILLSINGTIGNIALYRGEKIILGKSAAYINIKANFLNPLFLYYFLETNSLQRYFRSELTGTTIKNLSIKSIKKTKLYIPNITEQRKIGDFFRKLDQQIELEEKKLELLEQQKRGYMQKLFSQELRFKDKNGNQYPEWVTKKLGDIGKVAMNKRIYKNETTENGEIPFYKIGNFGKNADTFITREKFDEYKEKYPYPNVGDILISASGSIGRTIEYTGEDAYYQDSNIVWLNHNDEVINKYLKYFYKIVKWSGIEGTTIKRLYNKNILNTKIELPTVEEQYKMANFLSKLDKIIDIQIEKIELLKQRKQGLLQKMFI